MNLYKPVKIFDQDFIEKYFKSICHQLNWNLGNSIDNEKEKIIKIYKEESSFQITICPNQHVDVRVIKDGFKDIINEKMFQDLLQQKYTRNMSLLVPLFNSSLSMKDLFKLVNNNEQFFLQLVRQIRFDRVERKVNIIEQILNMRLYNPEIDRYLSGLILTLPANNGDYLKFILENFKEDFFHYLMNILHQEGSFIFLPLQMKHLNKDGAFDKTCSRINQLRCFSDSINNSLKQYFYMIAANIKKSETIDLLRSLMFFDILSFQEMIPFFKKNVDGVNDVLAYLILARKVTFQELMVFAEKYRDILDILDIVLFFDRARNVKLHELMSFLQKGMNHVSQIAKLETLNVIQELIQRERITFYEAKPFLKKALEEEVDLKEKRGMAYLVQAKGIEVALIFALNEKVPFLEIQPFLEKAVKDLNSENIILVFNVINDLLNEDKITLSQAKPFIKAAIKIKSSDLEYDKKEVQSLLKKYNKKHEKTLKSVPQGLLKRTKTVSMYHQPYASNIDYQDLEDPKIDFDSEELELSDADFQKYKELKEQKKEEYSMRKSLDDSDMTPDLITTSLIKLSVSKKIKLSNVSNISQVAQNLALKILR